MASLASAWLGAAPWLALAGAGALHGLNPCSGWALAAACRQRAPTGHGGRALGPWLPLALGHLASVGLVAGWVAAGGAPARLPWLAALGLAGLPLAWAHRRAGLALWSFGVATVHGSGLMLLPALVPLCLAGSPAREITASGSWGLALAAVAVHLAAMLAAMACAAWAAGRGLARWRRSGGPARAQVLQQAAQRTLHRTGLGHLGGQALAAQALEGAPGHGVHATGQVAGEHEEGLVVAHPGQ